MAQPGSQRQTLRGAEQEQPEQQEQQQRFSGDCGPSLACHTIRRGILAPALPRQAATTASERGMAPVTVGVLRVGAPAVAKDRAAPPGW